MGYVDRAKSMHARGEAVRAAVILAQGLKRDASDAEAVEWLLHLYVEEVPNTGMEEAILQVLCRLPNGGDLLEIVEAELDELGAHEKLRALEKTLEQSGIRFAAPQPEPVASEPDHAMPVSAGPDGDAERTRGDNWDAFDNPFSDGPRPVSGSAPGAGAADDDGLSFSQPLGTLDTLPEALRSEYLENTPLPSEQPSRGEFGVWIVVAAVAALIVASIAVYTLVAGHTDEPTSTWAEEGSGE